jgi:hypothetical protein
MKNTDLIHRVAKRRNDNGLRMGISQHLAFMPARHVMSATDAETAYGSTNTAAPPQRD